MGVNWTKLAGQMLITVCSTVLVATHAFDSAIWLAINGPLIGYVVGNGNSVRKGESSKPVIYHPKDYDNHGD